MSVSESPAETTTIWRLAGTGYEFCNCQPGCTCNFSGFPTSSDGSCKAAVANHVVEGHCGDVDRPGQGRIGRSSPQRFDIVVDRRDEIGRERSGRLGLALG